MASGRYATTKASVSRGCATLAVRAVCLLVAWLGFSAPAGAIVPGHPQVPQAPQQVFFENFEHVEGSTPILLTAYTAG